ncbi:hypothetical protein PNOK_0623900 [Pyrrhoderma noxium]|uniref:Uncharacterized protein n=1 Tax=Pyrrhoderma noxium TaxID=2282107 RepID=A0A286UDT5_9AGAM|nr:hypothetical protein PNOK_0623900 [Pyrrhoderma noxium]
MLDNHVVGVDHWIILYTVTISIINNIIPSPPSAARYRILELLVQDTPVWAADSAFPLPFSPSSPPFPPLVPFPPSSVIRFKSTLDKNKNSSRPAFLYPQHHRNLQFPKSTVSTGSFDSQLTALDPNISIKPLTRPRFPAVSIARYLTISLCQVLSLAATLSSYSSSTVFDGPHDCGRGGYQETKTLGR